MPRLFPAVGICKRPPHTALLISNYKKQVKIKTFLKDDLEGDSFPSAFQGIPRVSWRAAPPTSGVPSDKSGLRSPDLSPTTCWTPAPPPPLAPPLAPPPAQALPRPPAPPPRCCRTVPPPAPPRARDPRDGKGCATLPPRRPGASCQGADESVSQGKDPRESVHGRPLGLPPVGPG